MKRGADVERQDDLEVHDERGRLARRADLDRTATVGRRHGAALQKRGDPLG